MMGAGVGLTKNSSSGTIFSRIRKDSKENGAGVSFENSMDVSKENHARTTMSLLEYMNMQ